ncbi:LysR substrate-binding domain-containing protein [Mesorhizobium sp. SP-1A]|uniref:LysR substrate-binding domain-containing protein n=1 Tax=Mesorhizobium sp. SP-1A TaxID=3077840 RepID=UPI0028F71D07|nr:LysR substrate-binding domain-containing protein [Mesorhizobium sp. SP-1A]
MAASINFRHLEAIRALILSGSVTGAAARLNVTQPAVSQLIRDAEERLGFTLFNRELGRLSPTKKAELILEMFERSLSGLDAINDYCAHLKQSEHRRIVVSTIPSFAAAVLPQVIRTYRDEISPDFFLIKSANTEMGIASVRYNSSDLAFGVNLDPVPGVECATVCRSQALCYLPPDHPLGQKRVITPADLAGLPMITLSRMEGIAQAIAASIPDHGRAVVECPAAITVLALVEAGIGYTLLDPMTASVFRSERIILRHFSEHVPFDHRVYWSTSKPTGFELDRVIELSQSFAAAAVNRTLERVPASG